jgi:hypothetical protein
MALVKYIGPAASVNVGGVVCAKGNSIEVSTETATSLLGQAGTWEAGNKETEELAPFTPVSVLSFVGYQGAWDTRASYASGEVVTDGGVPFLSLTANTGEKPSSHPAVWLALGARLTKEEKQLGVCKTGETKHLDCSKPGLNVASVEGTPAFDFINKLPEGCGELALEWTVTTTEGAPTFTGVSWVSGSEPEWNKEVGAINVAFFYVRANGVVRGES